MGFKDCKGLIFALALLPVSLQLPAQDSKEQADSLVRLMQGSSLELIEEGPFKFRKAVDATFLHNGTYLICDTALWNVEAKLINAWGNVKLIQDETILTSDKLDYIIDDNLAEFRGSIVQLQNKENNILRSTNLDYNTKDSVATFRGGAAMKDKDGQVIESREGIYDSRNKTFDFDYDVNMYTDSVFVKTNHLVYDTKLSTAFFTDYIDFWNEGNMLSAGAGWYNRETETFFFKIGVHGLTDRQETWSDTLYVHKNTKDVEMFGNAQIQDTSRHVIAMAESLYYCDSVSTLTMKNQATVAMATKEKNKKDTIYAGADVMVYKSIKRCDIPESVASEAATRLANITFDAVAEFRRKAAEAAAKAKADAEAKAMEEDPNVSPKLKKKGDDDSKKGGDDSKNKAEQDKPMPSEENDTQKPASDSVKVASDSLSMAADTIPPLPDTSKVGFMTAVGRVRIFRKDIQVRCDSLNYCDLDSIARFFVNPIVWNDGNRQYTSDSMYVLVRNGGMDRASLMGNAFIITREDSIRYDQIKSAEVVAYFDSSSALKRFDALGGANAMFYLKENETLATVNKVESKLLSATLSDGQLDRVYYYDAPKNDAYPVAQMTDRDHKFKGFDWKDSQRPRGPSDITALKVKQTEREYYEGRPRARFVYTDKFFPGYMQTVYIGLEAARRRKNNPEPVPVDTAIVRKDSLDSVHTLLPAGDSLLASVSPAVPDSLGVLGIGALPGSLALPDSLVLPDSLAVPGSPVALDSLAASGKQAVADSSSVSAADSLLMIPPTKKELREEARKLAIARRDARWAKKDVEDAAKAAQKEQKKLEKKRARTRRLLVIQAEQDARDAKKRDEYVRYYEKKKAREEARAAARAMKETTKEKEINEQEPEPSGERPPQVMPGREVQTLDEPGRQTP